MHVHIITNPQVFCKRDEERVASTVAAFIVFVFPEFLFLFHLRSDIA